MVIQHGGFDSSLAFKPMVHEVLDRGYADAVVTFSTNTFPVMNMFALTSFLRTSILEQGRQLAKAMMDSLPVSDRVLYSFLGHSMGGLWLRAAFRHLEERGWLGRIRTCGFVTLATPHLGLGSPERGNWDTSQLDRYLWIRWLLVLANVDDIMLISDLLAETLLDNISLCSLRHFRIVRFYAVEHSDAYVGECTGVFSGGQPFRPAVLRSPAVVHAAFSATPGDAFYRGASAKLVNMLTKMSNAGLDIERFFVRFNKGRLLTRIASVGSHLTIALRALPLVGSWLNRKPLEWVRSDLLLHIYSDLFKGLDHTPPTAHIALQSKL